MYENVNLANDMEDLIMDFLLYRKTKKSSGVKAQSSYEAGKGWPSYESVQLPLIPEESMPKYYDDYSGLNYSWRYPGFDKGSDQMEMQSDVWKPKTKFKKAEDTRLYESDTYPEESNNYPKPDQMHYINSETQKDMELMQRLHSDINSKLQPYVDNILNEYEYMGSPVSDERISIETLNKIIDEVLDLASKNEPEVNEILNELERADWCRKRLLRSCVESIVLCDLYGRRRPMYRCIFGSAYEYFK